MELERYTSEKELSNLVEEGNGEKIRDIVDQATKDLAATSDTKKLATLRAKLKCEDEFPLMQGISSSVYYMISLDPHLMVKVPWGGLGVRIDSKKRKIGLQTFGENQLWFSQVKDKALNNVRMKDCAGWYAVAQDHSLNNASFHDQSFWFAETSGHALRYALTLDEALFFSRNSGQALNHSNNNNFALYRSHNTENTLEKSSNHGHSLESSRNEGTSLRGSKNYDSALAFSVNSGASLWYSTNSNTTLKSAKNGHNTLMRRFPEKTPKVKLKDIQHIEGETLTLEEISKKMGVTRERIRQIQKKALTKFRQRLRNTLNLSEEQFQLFLASIIFEGKSRGYSTPLSHDRAYVTNTPPYSTDLRRSDHIGYSAQQSKLSSYLRSGFTSRVMWGVRNGMFPNQDE